MTQALVVGPRGVLRKKNLGEARGLSQIGCVIRTRRKTDYFFFLATVFLATGFLAAAFFAGAAFFLAAGFFLAGINSPPFPFANAKKCENHVNN
ncbi:MAG: hypothetical protein ACOYMS_00465 [Terrimicrobiaceae bacterium]